MNACRESDLRSSCPLTPNPTLDRQQGVVKNLFSASTKFVHTSGTRLAALEVKSADADSISGMREFCSKYSHAKPYLIGGQGMPLEHFFTVRAIDFV